MSDHSLHTARTEFTPLNRTERGRVYRIAHRGASAYAPENSLQAFVVAAEMGADAVEVDIQITADDVPVVAHDSDLWRVFGIRQHIRELTYTQLSDLQLPDGAQPIPTFATVAETCAALKLGLYLDIKALNLTAAGSVFAGLHDNKLFDHAIFGSFYPDLLAEIRAASPKALTSILFSSTHVLPVPLAQSIGANYVHPCWERVSASPHELLTTSWMHTVREAGLGIVCWHEERADVIIGLRDRGVDAICTDTPDILTELTAVPYTN